MCFSRGQNFYMLDLQLLSVLIDLQCERRKNAIDVMCTDKARVKERMKMFFKVKKGYGSAASVGLISCLHIKTSNPRAANSNKIRHLHFNDGEII